MSTKFYNRASYRTSGTAGEQALACPKSMFGSNNGSIRRDEGPHARHALSRVGTKLKQTANVKSTTVSNNHQCYIVLQCCGYMAVAWLVVQASKGPVALGQTWSARVTINLSELKLHCSRPTYSNCTDSGSPMVLRIWYPLQVFDHLSGIDT